VWLALQRAGRRGYRQMIGDDVALARELDQRVRARPELEAGSQNLSITTFRFAPPSLAAQGEQRIAEVNRALLDRLKREGRAYVSHAVVRGRLFLRACIVNFRTTSADLEVLIEEVCRIGAALLDEAAK
jgi:glutamate/tyrosine decarboxylase-like PLP-dependent enzyme